MKIKNNKIYLPDGSIIESSLSLSGETYAYKVSNKYFVSPAVYYLLTDDKDVRDELLKQIKVVDLDKVDLATIEKEIEKITLKKKKDDKKK